MNNSNIIAHLQIEQFPRQSYSGLPINIPRVFEIEYFFGKFYFSKIEDSKTTFGLQYYL